MEKTLTIALSGNPNSGKTTIFNSLTGTRQKVGNWPGVTVEKKEGSITKFGRLLNIIDLPGTYSLTPFSIEEIVARKYILDENPDVVIDIIDTSNLERSLYLATQLRELDRCKVIFALNMADLAKTRGLKINGEKLAELLDVPVIFTIGNKSQGLDELIQKAIDLADAPAKPLLRGVKYNRDIEAAIQTLQTMILEKTEGLLNYSPRWTAIKLLEDDNIIKETLLEKLGVTGGDEILRETETARKHLMNRFDEDPEIIMTDERYGFIAGVIKEVFTASARQRVDISRNIDLVLTNRFVGFPIFIFFIWLMFQTTFSIGQFPMDWIDGGIRFFTGILENFLPESILKDLLVNGIIAGVGSVIVFLPNILILFFFIALFEDTGYMSRAAFLMDKIMHLIGLHGKSFIPMIIGFGCNVPAVMAARTLESEKDRILTILITPFMSCSARLPIYIVLAGTFFGVHAGSVIFGIYLTGIVLSIFTGRLFRSTLLKGADAPFVMELPPYRVPMVKSLLIHMWDRGKIFLRKMGGIILVGSVVIWALSSFPNTEPSGASGIDPIQRMENSYMGQIGKIISPVFEPIGIDWRGGVALLSGFVAKEIVVSTMGVLYAGENDESDALKKALLVSGMTPLSALAMMVFVLLYVPCLATMAAIKRETSLKWTLFSITYSTGLAWFMAFVVYQGGSLAGLG
ncbi:MAG: ferrous iron transport protein B [Desulfobacteraceae bacterium]|nr:ferrous iron transport protein B [Desulfobacteraceae bacterium]MBU4002529.1 ferrous iron transport protein B [Pseudomonadota bacterium]